MNQFTIQTHCPNCFSFNKEIQCIQCGFNKNKTNDDKYLPEFTALTQEIIVGRVLKSGGFGVVYAGWHVIFGKKIAIKEYFPERVGLAKRAKNRLIVEACEANEDKFNYWRKAFLKEGSILAKFQGKNHIVLIEHSFEQNGTAYMIMERLQGQTLEDLLGGVNKKGKLKRNLSNNEANQLIEALLNALNTLHYNQPPVFHRDISLSNIIVPNNNIQEIKLVDFGIACTSTESLENANHEIPYTPGFSSPEQTYNIGKTGAATDFYAFGAVIYSVLTKEIPLPVEQRQKMDNIIPLINIIPDIDPAVSILIDKCLNLNYVERPQSIEEINAILDNSWNKPIPINTLLPANNRNITIDNFKESNKIEPHEKQSAFQSQKKHSPFHSLIMFFKTILYNLKMIVILSVFIILIPVIYYITVNNSPDFCDNCFTYSQITFSFKYFNNYELYNKIAFNQTRPNTIADSLSTHRIRWRLPKIEEIDLLIRISQMNRFFQLLYSIPDELKNNNIQLKKIYISDNTQENKIPAVYIDETYSLNQIQIDSGDEAYLIFIIEKKFFD